MRQVFCALCAVAVVAITVLTGSGTRASDTTDVAAAPLTASLAAPANINQWALLSLAISAGALAIAVGGAPQRGRVLPAMAVAGDYAQRLIHQLARPAATTPALAAPAVASTARDTAALEELIETIGSRYLADLQSLHDVVEQSWAAEVAARDERIRELARQIEILAGERDVLASRVHELEQARADSAAALSAARDDLERRLASLASEGVTGGDCVPAASSGSPPGRGRANSGSRASRGRRSKGGR